MRTFLIGNDNTVDTYDTLQEAEEVKAVSGGRIVQTSEDLEADFSDDELLALYNAGADALGKPTVAAFSNKGEASTELFNLLEEAVGPEEKTEAPKEKRKRKAKGEKAVKAPKEPKEPKRRGRPPGEGAVAGGKRKRAAVADLVPSDFTDNFIIRILSNGNPKRPGTKAYDKFALFRDGMSVAEFIKDSAAFADQFGKNWGRSEMYWCLEHGYIAVEAPKQQAA